MSKICFRIQSHFISYRFFNISLFASVELKSHRKTKGKTNDQNTPSKNPGTSGISPETPECMVKVEKPVAKVLVSRPVAIGRNRLLPIHNFKITITSERYNHISVDINEFSELRKREVYKKISSKVKSGMEFWTSDEGADIIHTYDPLLHV